MGLVVWVFRVVWWSFLDGWFCDGMIFGGAGLVLFCRL